MSADHPRHALGDSEVASLLQCIDHYRRSGSDPGYGGVFEQRYTDLFCQRMGGGYANAAATGTGALYVAIAALELPEHSQVLVSPISDPGTYSAILAHGLIPRLVDAMPDSYGMGPLQLYERITEECSAVLVVHAAGHPCDMDTLIKVARRRNLRVIEDCSQAHGATLGCRPVGSFGDVSAYSTMYRKAHITGGSGGLVYTRDCALYHKIQAYADRGKPCWEPGFDDRNPEQFLFPALNWHTDELSCAIGIASLARLSDTIAKRIAFCRALEARMAGESIFTLSPISDGDSPFIWPVFVAAHKVKGYNPEISDTLGCAATKIHIAEAVRAEGVPLNPHYRYLAADWPWLKPHLADDFATPLARAARDRSFCLYLHEGYGESEAEDIARVLLKVSAEF